MRIWMLILIVFLALNFKGCKGQKDLDTLSEESSYNPRKNSANDSLHSEQVLLEILRCFDEEDREGLKKLFSVETKWRFPIDEEIEEAFDVYEGKSESYEKIWGLGSATAYRKDGIYVYKDCIPSMNGIRTDNGNIYSISYVEVLVDDENPKNEGIRYIKLYDTAYPDNSQEPVAVIGDY